MAAPVAGRHGRLPAPGERRAPRRRRAAPGLWALSAPGYPLAIPVLVVVTGCWPPSAAGSSGSASALDPPPPRRADARSSPAPPRTGPARPVGPRRRADRPSLDPAPPRRRAGAAGADRSLTRAATVTPRRRPAPSGTLARRSEVPPAARSTSLMSHSRPTGRPRRSTVLLVGPRPRPDRRPRGGMRRRGRGNPWPTPVFVEAVTQAPLGDRETAYDPPRPRLPCVLPTRTAGPSTSRACAAARSSSTSATRTAPTSARRPSPTSARGSRSPAWTRRSSS